MSSVGPTKQRLVSTLFHDAPTLEHKNAIHCADGRQPVRDDDRGPPRHQPVHRFLGLAQGHFGLNAAGFPAFQFSQAAAQGFKFVNKLSFCLLTLVHRIVASGQYLIGFFPIYPS